MSTTSKTNRPISLDDISKRKNEVKKEIEKQKEIMIENVRDIFYPEPAETGAGSYMQAFNKGLAIYDGVMTGIKIMRKVRTFFNRNKKNK